MLQDSQLKQYLLLGLIIGVSVFIATQLYEFFPGLLGAITLYILLRQWFFKVTVVYNWKKWLAALVFILGSLLVFVMPFGLIAMLLAPKLTTLMQNPTLLSDALNMITQGLHHAIPQLSLSEAQMREFLQKGISNLPGFLGSTLQVISNLILCFFLLYFMLVEGRRMERRLQNFLSLKDENIDDIWSSTRVMVVSNAIGIPLLAMFQAVTGTVGCLIFRIDGWLVWGILTGICSMLPVIGTAVIWAPLVAYLFATGHPAAASGFLLYSIMVTVNIDNVLRFTLLRKLGNVHPVITVLGIIIGVPVFGFMGLIFGPLMLSYFRLLIRIYQVEFAGQGLRKEG